MPVAPISLSYINTSKMKITRKAVKTLKNEKNQKLVNLKIAHKDAKKTGRIRNRLCTHGSRYHSFSLMKTMNYYTTSARQAKKHSASRK